MTALHEIPNGEVWPLEAILNQKTYIETYGLRWSVVESLPVSEAIKYGGAERDNLIENYKKSLINLGKAGSITTFPQADSEQNIVVGDLYKRFGHECSIVEYPEPLWSD